MGNVIHTFACIQLRLACAELMKQQGHEEETRNAKITPAFNLPCNYILPTIGSIVGRTFTKKDCMQFMSCYHSCLDLAVQNHLKSIAFCCISTGEFHFPNDKAAEIAVETVKRFQLKFKSNIKVLFNVFKDKDYEIYEKLLG